MLQTEKDYPVDLPDRLTRQVMVRAFDMVPGQKVRAHTHDWGQLAYASKGVMLVMTEEGNWVVPPQRAVWIPAGAVHGNETPHGAHFRSLHVANEAAIGLPDSCCVISVSPLLRELLITAANLSKEYDEEGPAGRLMQVILDEIKSAERAPLHLPLPSDSRLRRVANALIENPADPRTQDELAKSAGASSRTIARGFLRETGMNFSSWRQQCRLLASLEPLANGSSVTTVALELGYDSPSAFIAMFKRILGKSPTAYFSRKLV